MNEIADAGATPPDMPDAETIAPVAPGRVDHRFVFSGDTREYFRIWIVNLALSIATLGVYSAWAKVRTQRYFYGHTRVAGSPFEYLAQPLPILKGRIIAVVFFAAYVAAGELFPIAQIALTLLIAIATPWLVVRALMFRARYASWRGLTFRFVGGYGDAIVLFCVMYLLVPLTLGLIYPYIKAQQKRYIVENHRFGGRRFRFGAEAGAFYPPYLAVGACVALTLVGFAYFMVEFMTSVGVGAEPDRFTADLIAYAWIGVSYFIYFIGWIVLAARIGNLVYNNAALDGHGFRSTLRARDLIGIYLGNTVAILFSAGMLIPWAMIRLARYRAGHLVLTTTGGLDELTSEAAREQGAAASEMDSLFDLEIGL